MSTPVRAASALRTLGLETEAGKKFLSKLVRADPAIALLAVAMCLRTTGIEEKVLPIDAGMMTSDLLERAQEGSLRLARDQWVKGTPLVKFFAVQRLADAVFLAWRDSFAPEIPVTKTLLSLPEEELCSRMTVAAQAVAVALKAYAKNMGDPDKIYLDEDRFEGICKMVTSTVLQAFDDPNRYNHLKIHGVDPKEGGGTPPSPTTPRSPS